MNEHLILIAPRGHADRALSRVRARRVRTKADIKTTLERFQGNALWIAANEAALHLLLSSLTRQAQGDQRLLVLHARRREPSHYLHAFFRHVLFADEGIYLLPFDEMIEAIDSPDRADLFVGASFAGETDSVILYRGDLEPLVVPLTWFRKRPDGPPDPSRLAVADFGQTIRLGKYEAAADAILYDFDSDYRRRAKKRAIETDRSFGGALRRVRLQKGLRRGDFPGVTAKEIARIERGEVKRPHAHTVAAVAERLGVSPEEIADF
ncbi:MAG: helix-turn-helix domain-containing protein [Deltaproteobacteria bacterium]|nr:helix-turn-helix domain-containing protein [Deltaproteobacteria bacterium]